MNILIKKINYLLENNQEVNLEILKKELIKELNISRLKGDIKNTKKIIKCFNKIRKNNEVFLSYPYEFDLKVKIMAEEFILFKKEAIKIKQNKLINKNFKLF